MEPDNPSVALREEMVIFSHPGNKSVFKPELLFAFIKIAFGNAKTMEGRRYWILDNFIYQIAMFKKEFTGRLNLDDA